MNRKNVIRTLTAIAVVLLLGWSFFYFSDDTRGFKPVDTSVAMAQIKGGNVKSAQIDDREQQVRMTLKSAATGTEGSDKIITHFPTGYAVPLFDQLNSKDTQVSTVVNQGSIIGSLVIYVLPLLLLVGLFEHVADAACADADEHLNEVRTGNGEEGNVGFAGDRARDQRLAGAGRADQ